MARFEVFVKQTVVRRSGVRMSTRAVVEAPEGTTPEEFQRMLDRIVADGDEYDLFEWDDDEEDFLGEDTVEWPLVTEANRLEGGDTTEADVSLDDYTRDEGGQ
jgi:hypothetical protein